MSISNSVKNVINSLLSFNSEIWHSYRPRCKSTQSSVSILSFKSLTCVSAKFFGRTLSIAIAAGITTLALNALAKTALGSLLGTTAFVASVNALPFCLVISAAAITILGTGLLTSVLIEVYS